MRNLFHTWKKYKSFGLYSICFNGTCSARNGNVLSDSDICTDKRNKLADGTGHKYGRGNSAGEIWGYAHRNNSKICGWMSACGYIGKKTYKYDKMDIELRKTVDSGEEKALLLSEKNKALAEKQNSEIYAATLRERNRIAREIHDNVGHVLSRTILLTGAARAINKDQNLDSLLKGLDNSLNSAMDSIRSSVHDLHDDAVNLQETIKGIITDIKIENVEFEYDMSEIIPREIKYCFISIVKEAISNAMKYSSATQIKIIMREHPAIYQLCIEDNGKGCADYDKNTTGIGLKNMQERVNTLNGNLQINGEKGFRIFVVIPKQNRAE